MSTTPNVHMLDIAAVAELAGFLNRHNGREVGEMSMQMLKLAEEYGEAVSAWIGYTGQNPRKGVTHSLDDVLDELADVAIAAMVGIQRLGADSAAVIGVKIAQMQGRYDRVEATR